jgi:hypothetical protein
LGCTGARSEKRASMVKVCTLELKNVALDHALHFPSQTLY